MVEDQIAKHVKDHGGITGFYGVESGVLIVGVPYVHVPLVQYFAQGVVERRSADPPVTSEVHRLLHLYDFVYGKALVGHLLEHPTLQHLCLLYLV